MNRKNGLLILVVAVPLVTMFVATGLFKKPERPQLKRFFELSETFKSDYSTEVGKKRYHIVPPFEFMAQDSSMVTEKTFKDKIFIADFFFTRCGGVCPKLTRAMKKVQDMYGDDETIMFLSHTVDPEFDSPDVLANYAERFGADTRQWFFVTGEADDIYHQAEVGYYLYAAPGTDGSAEEFDHSGKLILVDKDRIIRGYYDGTVDSAVTRLKYDIKVLQLEYLKDDDVEYIPGGKKQ